MRATARSAGVRRANWRVAAMAGLFAGACFVALGGCLPRDGGGATSGSGGPTSERVLTADEIAELAAQSAIGAVNVVLVGVRPGPGPLIGEVRMLAGSKTPVEAGWLPCDGRELSRTEYARLFEVVGGTYGAGDGVSTFAIPDFRNRSPMGAIQTDGGELRTTVSGTPTVTGGAASQTLTVEQLPEHMHAINPADPAQTQQDEPSMLGDQSASFPRPGKLAGRGKLPAETAAAGGGHPHSVLDPYAVVQFIIFAGEPTTATP